MNNTGSHTDITITGCVAVITLNDPPGNTIHTPAFISPELFSELEENPDIRGIVIIGAGRHFSAGADTDTLFSMSERNTLFSELESGKQLLQRISSCRLPVIAAISGVCFGAGLEIALACHVRFCSANSLFAFPEINLNLMPGLGGCVRLLRQSGTFASFDMIFSGDVVNAGKAAEYGLVDQVVSSGSVAAEAVSTIQKWVGSRPRKVIESIMQALQNAANMSREKALTEETRLFCELAIDENQRRKKEQS